MAKDEQTLEFVIRMREEASAVLKKHVSDLGGVVDSQKRLTDAVESQDGVVRGNMENLGTWGGILRAIGGILPDTGRKTSEFANEMTAVGVFTDAASGTMGRYTRAAGLFGDALSSIGPKGAIAAAGLGALTLATHASLEEFASYERTVIRFNASLRITGTEGRATFDELEELAGKLAETTTAEDDTVIRAGSNLVRYARLSKETFEEALKTSVDFSEAYGTSIEGAADMIGRALENPTLGANMLRRQLRNLTATDMSSIRDSEEAGNYDEARELLMKRIQERTRGMATEMRQGLGGAWGEAQKQMGEFFEAHTRGFGRFLSQTLRLTSVLNSVADGFKMVGNASATAWNWVNSPSAPDAGARPSSGAAGNPEERLRALRSSLVRAEAAARKEALGAIGRGEDDDMSSLSDRERRAYSASFETSMRSTGASRLRQQMSEILSASPSASGFSGREEYSLPMPGTYSQDAQTRQDSAQEMLKDLDPTRKQIEQVENQIRLVTKALQETRETEPLNAEKIASYERGLRGLEATLRGIVPAFQAVSEARADAVDNAGRSGGERALTSIRNQFAAAYASDRRNGVTEREAREVEQVRTQALESYLKEIEAQGRAEEDLARTTEMSRALVVASIREGAAAEEEANRQLQVREKVIASLGVRAYTDPALSAAAEAEEARLNRQTSSDQTRNRLTALQQTYRSLNDEIRNQSRLAGAGPNTDAIRRATMENEAYTVAIKAGKVGSDEFNRAQRDMMALLEKRASTTSSALLNTLRAETAAIREQALAAREGAASFQLARDSAEARARNLGPGGASAVADNRAATARMAAEQAQIEQQAQSAKDRAYTAAISRGDSPTVAAEKALVALTETRLRMERELAALRERQAANPPPALNDTALRVLHGEAAGQGPDGIAAVAHVMRNRARLSGQTLDQVATQSGQFEPWGTAASRARLMALTPEQLSQTRAVMEGVLAGNIADPTNGATHFLNPDLQRRLGRAQPAWAPEGQGTRVGDHVFYSRPGDIRPGPSTALEDSTAALRTDQETQLTQMRDAARRRQVEARKGMLDQTALATDSQGAMSRGEINPQQLAGYQEAYNLTLQDTGRNEAAWGDRLRANLDVIRQRNTAQASLDFSKGTSELGQQTDMLQRQAQIGATSTLERERQLRIMEMENELTRQGISLTGDLANQRRAGIEANIQAQRQLNQSQSQLSRFGSADGKESWERWDEIATSSMRSLNDGLAEAVMNWDKMGETASSVLKNIGTMILREVIAQSVTRPAASALASFFGFAGKAVGAFGGGGADGGMKSFADGGIMTPHGVMELRKYAKGGVADSPQLALFGEGSMNEAYVPLPDGRSIPVTISAPAVPAVAPRIGGGGNTIIISPQITVEGGGSGGSASGGGGEGGMSNQQAERMSNEVTRTLQAVVAAEIERQTRNGGMLNPNGV